MELPFSADALNRHLPTPLYDQLTNLILDAIRRGELRPGDILPAEWLIAQDFRVSKATVRRALDELTNRGVLERFQGRGTFVALPRVSLGPTHFESFSVQMMARGVRPSSRVLEQRVVAAEDEIAQKLSVTQGSRILRLRRIRLADEQPMGVQTAYVPLELAPGLENKDFQRTSLYRVLKEDYGLVAAYAQETHSAIALDSDCGKLLGAAAGTPALSSRRLTLLASRRPMEFVYSVMRGDRYEVFLELSANAMGVVESKRESL
jgi:GntR family transcriptional regulator